MASLASRSCTTNGCWDWWAALTDKCQILPTLFKCECCVSCLVWKVLVDSLKISHNISILRECTSQNEPHKWLPTTHYHHHRTSEIDLQFFKSFPSFPLGRLLLCCVISIRVENDTLLRKLGDDDEKHVHKKLLHPYILLRAFESLFNLTEYTS